MCDPTMIHSGATLADLATNWAGASRVFQRHDLDFCCQGRRTLADACRERAPVVDHFHARHRAELPRLIAMAEKVERVHADRPNCPIGLAAHLHTVEHDLGQHMQKEEVVLFPMMLAGAGARAAAPIQCMTAEHDEHGRALARSRELAHGFVPPSNACGTWRALYLGLAEFEREVMEHVHLENHVLFPRALHDATNTA